MKRTVEVDRDLALIGATMKVKELLAEMNKIYEVFPELRRASLDRQTMSTAVGRRRKRVFSAAAKRKMSAGMRKYWARRKASAKQSTKTAKSNRPSATVDRT